MEFTKLLEERRSIRAFAPEKHVTAEQIQEIVQAAIQAPSWKNSQTTRYYALVTPEKVEEFSALSSYRTKRMRRLISRAARSASVRWKSTAAVF